MKILHLGTFDCAAVAWNQSVAFNRLFEGKHEMRTCFSVPTMAAPDAHMRYPVDSGDARAAVKDTDLVILHAGVWDYNRSLNTGGDDAPLRRDILEVPWIRKACPPSKAILLLNGSTTTRKNPVHYRKLYEGYRIVTSNTDMAALYGGSWVPPCVVEDWDDARVTFRFGAGRTVCHFGTDPRIKNTQDLYRAASFAGWTVRHAQNEAHDRLPLTRNKSQVCFDHMQGYTCVVSMESAALGQANIVHMNETERAAWKALSVPVPPFYDVQDADALGAMLVRFMGAMPEVAERGRAARAWYEEHMRNESKARLFAELVL